MRRAGRDRTEEGESRGSPIWMVTYADFATLLLALFVLLTSMSSPNAKQLRGAFHNFCIEGGEGRLRDAAGSTRRNDALEQAVMDLRKEIRGALKGDVRDVEELTGPTETGRIGDAVSSAEAVWIGKDASGAGFCIILGSGLLFETGSATLQPQAVPVLEKVGELVRKSDCRVNIDAHTAEQAGNSADPSGEVLSLAQAQTVLNFLMRRYGVDPKRFAIGAYGSSQPLARGSVSTAAPGDERVEIVFERT